MLRITDNFTTGVAAENSAWEQLASDTERMEGLDEAATFVREGGSLAPTQYEGLLSRLPLNTKRVLDVGVGRGQSSMYLALQGYEVVAIEPNLRFCSILESEANRFGLHVTPCHGVAEDINKIDAQFDAVFFNASLHHCDDPRRALRFAFDRLKPGGKIFLVNENFLRPWRSKAWFQRMLVKDPTAMGHYGGNEHAYHNWDYAAMLRAAGFNDLEWVRPVSGGAISKLEFVLLQRVNGHRMYRTKLGIAARFLYYVVEEMLGGNKTLARASLIPCQFIASR